MNAEQFWQQYYKIRELISDKRLTASKRQELENLALRLKQTAKLKGAH